jgi:hypothetical protein
MKRFLELFGKNKPADWNQRVFLPVIHVKHGEEYETSYRGVRTALEAGADGAFLIEMSCRTSQGLMTQVAHTIQESLCQDEGHASQQDPLDLERQSRREAVCRRSPSPSWLGRHLLRSRCLQVPSACLTQGSSRDCPRSFLDGCPHNKRGEHWSGNRSGESQGIRRVCPRLIPGGSQWSHNRQRHPDATLFPRCTCCIFDL